VPSGLTPVNRTLPGYDSRLKVSGKNSQRHSQKLTDEAIRQFENMRARIVAYSCPSNTLKLVALALKRRQALVWGGLVKTTS
jgi:hypothetical protein